MNYNQYSCATETICNGERVKKCVEFVPEGFKEETLDKSGMSYPFLVTLENVVDVTR